MVANEKNDEFSDLKKIGEGGFGIVSKAIWKRQHRQLKIIVAIKTLKNENDIDKFKQELKIIKKVCKNPKRRNIIKFHKTIVIHNNSFNMVFQFANKGDLRTYLEKSFEKLTWIQKLQMAYEISKGVEFLHKFIEIFIPKMFWFTKGYVKEKC
ncbi:kinase-like domain-containing protein [Gigaspora rosea]|uniref:Kinase-like domain-containing protein n=1 Tax=Gigaspora rosea TaxID=44941 RepID=A0A397U7U8_9GLOM|nr:kinase-like domain-containing protein [Gigaspora rosea]